MSYLAFSTEQPCWFGHCRPGVACLTLPKRLWNAFVLPFCPLTKGFTVHPQSPSSGPLSPLTDEAFISVSLFLGLICEPVLSVLVCLAAYGSPPPHPNSARASIWGMWAWTWLRFPLPELASILLNDYTRRIPQLYRNWYFFKDLY